ncbi:MAG: PHB depolymerase family esterase, partial [Pseudomonadota bacterium]
MSWPTRQRPTARHRQWGITLVGALFSVLCGACMEAGQATAEATPGFEQHTLRVDGTRREYALYVPEELPSAGERALVIVFHGGEGSPDKIARQTGFNEQADRSGFVVAYPRSIEHWNDGRSTTSSFGDDVAFTRALIET